MTAEELVLVVKRITSRIVEEYQPEKIILFGSAAAGKMHPDSDLDLAIVKDTDKRFYDRIGEVLGILYSHLPTPGIGVDVIVYTPQEFNRMQRDDDFVKQEILNQGSIIYER